MKKLRYKIIDLISSFAIYYEGKWKYDKNKNKKVRIERDWAINLHSYAWWLKWQYNLKYNGEQDWRPIVDEKDALRAEATNYIFGEKHRYLFRILIG